MTHMNPSHMDESETHTHRHTHRHTRPAQCDIGAEFSNCQSAGVAKAATDHYIIAKTDFLKHHTTAHSPEVGFSHSHTHTHTTAQSPELRFIHTHTHYGWAVFRYHSCLRYYIMPLHVFSKNVNTGLSFKSIQSIWISQNFVCQRIPHLSA